MKIARGNVVRLDYELRIKGGEVVETSARTGPIQFVQGDGKVLPALEKRLVGLEVGDRLEGEIPAVEATPPEEALPTRDIARTEFPKEGLEVGAIFEAHTKTGGTINMRILEIDDTQVHVRLLPQLAGKDLAFKVRVVMIEDPVNHIQELVLKKPPPLPAAAHKTKPPQKPLAPVSANDDLVIVAGVQFDASADAVWDKAQALLTSRPDARLHICTVVGTAAVAAESHKSLVDEAMKKLHVWVTDKGGDDPVLAMQLHLDVAIGDPAEELVQAAVDVEADLIVLGSHHRKTVARLVLGSVAEKVLHRAPCSVLIAQPSNFEGLHKSPTIAPAPEPGHKGYRPHGSATRSSVPLSQYSASLVR